MHDFILLTSYFDWILSLGARRLMIRSSLPLKNLLPSSASLGIHTKSTLPKHPYNTNSASCETPLVSPSTRENHDINPNFFLLERVVLAKYDRAMNISVWISDVGRAYFILNARGAGSPKERRKSRSSIGVSLQALSFIYVYIYVQPI